MPWSCAWIPSPAAPALTLALPLTADEDQRQLSSCCGGTRLEKPKNKLMQRQLHKQSKTKEAARLERKLMQRQLHKQSKTKEAARLERCHVSI